MLIRGIRAVAKKDLPGFEFDDSVGPSISLEPSVEDIEHDLLAKNE